MKHALLILVVAVLACTPSDDSVELDAGTTSDAGAADAPLAPDARLPSSGCGDSVAEVGETCFSAPITVPLGEDVYDLTTGDFDGDGFPDLAALREGELLILHGDGTGAFDKPPLRRDVADTARLVAADFNDDGVDDVIVSHYLPTGCFTLFFGGPIGLVQTPLPCDGTSAGALMVVGAIDPNPAVDFAAFSSGVGVTHVAMLNRGGGTFEFRSLGMFSEQVLAAAAFDLNGDALDDLVTAGTASGDFAVVNVHMNSGGSSFLPPVADGVPCQAEGLIGCAWTSVAAGFFDDDAFADVAAGGHGVTEALGMHVFIGAGDGRLLLSDSQIGRDDITSIAVIDADHDARADLLVGSTADETIDVWTGLGGGLFANATSTTPRPLGRRPFITRTSDLNLDGADDFVTLNTLSDNASIFLADP